MDDQDFKDVTAAADAKRIKQENDDLLHGSAGVQTGRNNPLADAPYTALSVEREEKEHNKRLTAQMLAMLQDQAYEKLYEETMDMLTRYEQAADRAMSEETEILKRHQEAIADKLGKAGRLSDGTVVFRDKHGDVYDENQRRIEDQTAIDGIVWRDDAPTYEEYLADKHAIAVSEERIEEIRRYQTDVLGNARLRMTDEDDKPDAEEVQKIQEEIKSSAPVGVTLIFSKSQVQSDLTDAAPQNKAVPML